MLVREQALLRNTAHSRLRTLGRTTVDAPDNPLHDGEQLLARMQARHTVDPKHSLMQRLSRLASVLGPFERHDFSPDFVQRLQEEAAGRKILYVSTPVTGGNRLYEFLDAKGKQSVRDLSPTDNAEFVSQVIEKNCSAAGELADTFRTDDTLVVDPSRLAVNRWQQAEYLNHWLDVVKIASGVVLQDGWELSEGCVHEARTAFSLGIPVCDARGETLTRDTALARLEASLARVREAGFNPPDLKEVLLRNDAHQAEVPEPTLFKTLFVPDSHPIQGTYPLPAGKVEQEVVHVARTLSAACEQADAGTRRADSPDQMRTLEDRMVAVLDGENPEAVDALEAILAEGSKKLNGAALPSGFEDCGKGVFTLNLHEVARNKQAFLGNQVGLLVVDTTPDKDGMNYYIVPVEPRE